VKGIVKLEENVLGQVFSLLVTSCKLVRYVEYPFGISVNEHFPSSFFAF
jgi:hypothetical protein